MTEQYERTEWRNGETKLNQTNMNHIEIGISNNSADISVLKGDMKFKGVVSVLPTQDVEIGNVYQAAASGLYDLNKVGDLLVCTGLNPTTWHVIPSGDETSGTVTSISAGTGLAGGTITGSGSISLDANYTANANRNGLLSKEDFQKLRDVDLRIARDGDFNQLTNVPQPLANLQVKQEEGTGDNSQNWVMSQYATTTALAGKSAVGHHHESFDDIDGLGDALGNRALADHEHGNIATNGHLKGASGEGYYPRTDVNGKLVPQFKIPGSDVSGGSIFGVNIGELRSDATQALDILTPEGAESPMSKAATASHTHLSFANEAAVGHEGFVPAPPAEHPEDYILAGDGTWKSAVNFSAEEAVINLIYPVGAYFETSSPTFNPTKKQWFNPATQTYVDSETTGVVYAHDKWPGNWVLENPGLFHASGNATTAGYICNATSGANKTDGKGYADAGAAAVKLTYAQSGRPACTVNTTYSGAHTHDMGGQIWSSDSGGKTNAYTMSSKRKVKNRSTGGVSATHIHSVTIPDADATSTHENRPPYVAVYRWHRIPEPPTTT